MSAKKPKLLLTAAAFFIFFKSYPQKIDSTLNEYYSLYNTEKIHIHFDKDTYVGGDTIWFKIYLMQANPSANLSKNLYLDLWNEEGKLIEHQVFPIGESSTTFGQFIIPNQYNKSLIHINAYTKWMLNFDTAFLYNKNITILPFDETKTTKKIKPAPVLTSLQFFPEGGDAITGINNRIAFKANDQWGRPVEITGEIRTSKNNKVADLQILHDGMGIVNLKPEEGEIYTAYWKDSQDNAHQTTLPITKLTGVVLSVMDENNKKKFTIERTENATEANKELHLIATQQFNLIYQADIPLQQKYKAIGSIEVDDLPTGILTITLFNSNWQPICERICYVNNPSNSAFSTQIKLVKKNLKKKGLNQLEVNIPDSISANLSVSITDGELDSDTSENIFSNLLLSGDIRGKVYNAAYYLSDTTSVIKRDMDLVMLTNGWRRYNWDKIVKGESPDFLYSKETEYYTLSGKLSDVNEKKIKKFGPGSLFLVPEIKGVQYPPLIINLKEDGSFSDSKSLMFDSTKLYYKFTNKSLATASSKIQLESFYDIKSIKTKATSLSDIKVQPYSIAPLQDSVKYRRNIYLMDLAKNNKEYTLKSVTVKTRVKTIEEKLDETYVNNNFFKNNGASSVYVVDVKNDPNAVAFMDIFQYLQGRIAGLSIIRNGSDNIHIALRGDSNVFFFLNEVPLPQYNNADIEIISGIATGEIAYVKAFPAPFVGAPLNGSAIAIYLKKPGERSENPKDNMPFIYTEGYTNIKEFYLPIYDERDTLNLKPDNRSTIYWHPMVITTKQEPHFTINFYNNDISNSFRIKIEGIDKNGKLTSIEKKIQ